MSRIFDWLLGRVSAVLQVLIPRQAAATTARATPDDSAEPQAGKAGEEAKAAGYETSDSDPKVIAIFTLGLFALIFGTMIVLGGMYVYLYRKTPAMPVRPGEASFQNSPKAKTSIDEDWGVIDAQARQRLEGYGWADRKQGVARVPISRAMELVVKEGLPARAGQQTPLYPAPDQEKLPLTETLKVQDAPPRLTSK